MNKVQFQPPTVMANSKPKYVWKYSDHNIIYTYQGLFSVPNQVGTCAASCDVKSLQVFCFVIVIEMSPFHFYSNVWAAWVYEMRDTNDLPLGTFLESLKSSETQGLWKE